MQRKLRIAMVIVMILMLGGFPAEAKKKKKKAEPDRVVVQHFLIGFKGSVKGKEITRTKKEAGKLAEELYRKALDGADFDALVKEYTNDSYPGILGITNDDAPMRGDSRTRAEFVYGFGDVAFKLEVGEIGIAYYGYSSSPYGWHVIKRLE